MITPHEYWMGRDAKYAAELTQAIRDNATDLLQRVNTLLDSNGLTVEISPVTGSPVNSGWRPAVINASTYNSALHSKHMTGQAIDLHDPDGTLDDWCMARLSRLAEAGLWLEHPASTKGWCHLQSVPPHSGNRVFYP